MTAEALLIPRFEVISDYPYNEGNVGDILEYTPKNNFKVEYWVELHEKYPHIFKKLNWWEKRAIEQMPKRLKFLGDGDILNIKKWDIERYIAFVENGTICSLTEWNPKFGYIPFD